MRVNKYLMVFVSILLTSNHQTDAVKHFGRIEYEEGLKHSPVDEKNCQPVHGPKKFDLCLIEWGLDIAISDKIRVIGDFEPHISRVLTKSMEVYHNESIHGSLYSDPVLVDIGGHIGKHSMSIATLHKRLQEDLVVGNAAAARGFKVWCVEPFTRNLVHAYKSAQLNGVEQNIHFIQNTVDFESGNKMRVFGIEGMSAGMTVTPDDLDHGVIKNVEARLANEINMNDSSTVLNEGGIESTTLQEIIEDVVQETHREEHGATETQIEKQHSSDEKKKKIPIIMKLDVELMELKAMSGSLPIFLNTTDYFIPYILTEWLYVNNDLTNNYGVKHYTLNLQINVIHVLLSLGYEAYTEMDEGQWRRLDNNVFSVLNFAFSNVVWRKLKDVTDDDTDIFQANVNYDDTSYYLTSDMERFNAGQRSWKYEIGR